MALSTPAAPKMLVSAANLDPRLKAWLESQPQYSASFETFFAAALFHPKLGYYTNHIQTLGRRGDFSTSAHLDPDLPRSIASWAKKNATPSFPATLVEIGGGDGQMMFQIQQCWPWYRRRPKTKMVEISPTLRAQQHQCLGKFSPRIQWHDDLPHLVASLPRKTHLLAFANELIDAFPPRVFEKFPEGWREIGIALDENASLVEIVIPNATLPESSAVASNRFPIGQRVEVHQRFFLWLQELATALATNDSSADLLLIDYGEEIETLYHRRPHGTLRGYFRQIPVEGSELFHRFGHQDLTSDVNFTDLRQQAKHLGFAEIDFRNQADFVQKFANRPQPQGSRLENVRSHFQVLHLRTTPTSPRE